jgi:hypothetical protein
MKNELQECLKLAPNEERALLDEIRNDHELIERLKITHQEMEALSKCALLGTLTCRQDMLFILRQIREATGPSLDHPALFPQPLQDEDDAEAADSLPDFRHIPIRQTPGVLTEPGSLEGIVRRHLPEQFGVLFWVVVLVVGLVWNGALMVTRWRDSFMTAIGNAPLSQTSASSAWYERLDHFNFLLAVEILSVAGVAGVMYLRNRRNSRRFKVRPGGRYN